MVAPTKNKKFDPNLPCPCGSGLTYGACCCDYLEHGRNVTEGPLTVLRTRFVAYKLGFYDYVLRSWHPDYRPKIKPQIIALKLNRKLSPKKVRELFIPSLKRGYHRFKGSKGLLNTMHYFGRKMVLGNYMKKLAS